jgi:IPT/TIG domain
MTVKPTITKFSPTSAKPAGMITITGTHFTGTKTVTIDGTKSAFKVVSASKLTLTLPAKAKSGKIEVTTAGGTATSSGALKVS